MTLGKALAKAVNGVDKVYNKNVEIYKAWFMDCSGRKNNIDSANITVEFSSENPVTNQRTNYEVIVHVTKDSIKVNEPYEIQ